MMFVTLQVSLKKLPECEQGEFERLEDLTIEQKLGWLNSIKLDKPFEGRMEFFETHWQRLADLAANPVIRGEILYRNLRLSREGLIYLEPQVNAFGYLAPDGSEISPDEVAKQINARLAQEDAQSPGLPGGSTGHFALSQAPSSHSKNPGVHFP